MHALALPLFKLAVPEHSTFPDLLEELTQHSFKLEQRQRGIRPKTLLERRKTSSLFLEGLYQAHSALLEDTAIAFANSQRFYEQGNTNKVSQNSFRNVQACYRALVDLGWVSFCPGFMDVNGQGQPTTLAPAGALLARFHSTKTHWRRVVYTGDTIIIRHKDKITGIKQVVDVPDTPEIHLMRQQVQQINEFLSDQAIYLNLPNESLKDLAMEMGGNRYNFEIGVGLRRSRPQVLNFSQVGLRRIFAKGRVDRGGRFYGGWWQTVPKEYRRYITINGKPTVEIDFSELHPRMLYLMSGQQPPQNIYDHGIRGPDDPTYDPQIEPHKTSRKIIKTFLNALINDEHGRHRLCASQAQKLGMGHSQLKKLVLQKHPVIENALGTDFGLQLQFLDSEIASRVMMRLKDQAIVALPVHDSFLVQVEFENELTQAMRQEFTAVMNAQAQLKSPELPQDAFISLSGNRLLTAHRESFHNKYVQSWRWQHLIPKHPNLSTFSPYRFPDEITRTELEGEEGEEGEGATGLLCETIRTV